MADERIQEILKKLKKNAGAHASVHLGTDLSMASHVPFGIPTGIPRLDLSLRRPGYPAGRVVEAYGKEMSGKTTSVYHAIHHAQRRGGIGALIDTEQTYDARHAAMCGVDTDNLLYSECMSLEACFREIENIMEATRGVNVPVVIGVDSVQGALSENEMDKEIGEEYRVGQDARVIKNALRKLLSDIAETNLLVMFINHSIANIGNTFGKKSDSGGGRAIKFFSSVRVEYNFVAQIFEGSKDKRTRAGQKSAISVIKNKVARTGAPSFQAEMRESGFDLCMGLLDAFQDIGVVSRPTSKTYLFQPTETQFQKAEWAAFVESQGGVDLMYDWFIKTAIKYGFMDPYTDLDIPNLGETDGGS